MMAMTLMPNTSNADAIPPGYYLCRDWTAHNNNGSEVWSKTMGVASVDQNQITITNIPMSYKKTPTKLHPLGRETANYGWYVERREHLSHRVFYISRGGNDHHPLLDCAGFDICIFHHIAPGHYNKTGCTIQ
tara:strand:+ start:324 stop:719 length:396 start_codon:yes stop_codon:yes gene_type:complete